jgi:hypothetical protein
MHRVLITESSLRELLKEMMDSSAPVNVSPVVDPQAAETDPMNPNFSPSNKIELMSALRSLVGSIEDEDSSGVYVAIKDAIEEKEDEDVLEEKENEMKKQNVEESVREIVRKMLLEAQDDEEMDVPNLPPVKKIPVGVHGSEYMKRFEKAKSDLQKTLSKTSDEEDFVSADEPAAGRSRKNIMMSDVGGASFKDIAKEMGFAAESGAKQAVEKALSKAKFVMKMDMLQPEELEIMVLQSMSDYIDILKNAGELDPSEVKTLKDNPGIVRELDGFREFLDKTLRKARKDQDIEE